MPVKQDQIKLLTYAAGKGDKPLDRIYATGAAETETASFCRQPSTTAAVVTRP